MKIHDLIHEQSCRIDAVEETLRNENSTLAQMQDLQVLQKKYLTENPSKSLYVFICDIGYDLTPMQMNLIDEI